MNLFFELHKDIPREGPGSDESTAKAFQIIAPFVSKPRILDIGCGPGMQTMVLANLTDGTITAIDVNEAFLNVLRKKVDNDGFNNKVLVEKADMKALPYEKNQFDVIWSEGAIFIMGFEAGLREWRNYLRDHGILVVSELSWLKHNPPAEPRDFWDKAYPAAGTVLDNRVKAEQLGFEVIDTFVLPESGWWENYYLPLEEKIRKMREDYQDDQQSLGILQEFQTEIDLYRRFSEYYGYVFYLLRKQEKTDLR